jgi:hypothetical protein
MSRPTSVRHEFVEFIPEELEERIIYVSIPYATAVHKCLSGCGQEVVTPLSPRYWELVFDGETISLYPSVGNWSLPCRSHYWIRRNTVKWARKWSEAEVERARTRDRAALDSYFDRWVDSEEEDALDASSAKSGKSLWSKVKGWLSFPGQESE